MARKRGPINQSALDRIKRDLEDAKAGVFSPSRYEGAVLEHFGIGSTPDQEEQDSLDRYNEYVDRIEESRRKFSAMSNEDLARRCGIDFSLFQYESVTPVPYEGRPPFVGPFSSSRLVGHQFVPPPEFRDEMIDALVNGTLPPEPSGYVLVLWKKTGKHGNESTYGPVSLSEYREFKNAPSKGQAVVLLPNHKYGWLADKSFWST